ncbi:MAG: acyl carrier protein [Actinobacteria bacterium]|nr:acyl carrier protein [Actinomycetota bacterium]
MQRRQAAARGLRELRLVRRSTGHRRRLNEVHRVGARPTHRGRRPSWRLQWPPTGPGTVPGGSRRAVAIVPAETHVQEGPIERPEVLQLVKDRLADILEIDPSTIDEGDSFAEDLHADSLALIELVEALEDELSERSEGFRIEDEDLEDLKTVRDAVDYVLARV